MIRRAAAIAFGVALVLFSVLVGGRWSSNSQFDPTTVSSGSRGLTLLLGSKYFYAVAGSELDLDYDVTVDYGQFLLMVFPLRSGNNGHTAGTLTVDRSGPGHWSLRIPESGVYWLNPTGATVRGGPRGYKYKFDLRWRIHQGG